MVNDRAVSESWWFEELGYVQVQYVSSEQGAAYPTITYASLPFFLNIPL